MNTVLKALLTIWAATSLTYSGSSGIGGTVHLGMEKFSRLTGMKLKHVAYKGSAPSLLALMGAKFSWPARASCPRHPRLNPGRCAVWLRWA